MAENDPFESYFHVNHLRVPPTLACFWFPALHPTCVFFVSIHLRQEKKNTLSLTERAKLNIYNRYL